MTDQVAESPVTETKPAPVTRHKLTTVIDGVSVSVLKYAFPVKAAKYPIKVNGVPVDAATTGGKGKSYTYFIVNNTSFYVPGVLPVDAELSIDFPGDYKFDDALTARVSSYKPKPKVEKTEGEVAAAEGIAAVTGEVSEAPAEASEIPADAPKAKRRGK